MGRLIPAGTGLGAYKRLTVDVALEDEDEDDLAADGSYSSHASMDMGRGRDVDALDATAEAVE
jgi:hypothetical protein